MDKIQETLSKYISSNNIPNILFHGADMPIIINIITEFVQKIYSRDPETIRSYVLTVNCGHNKGIKFIREDVIFFAKTHINITNGMFKSIVMLNADKLTVDAQSALRRCIEIFSHTTRFFVGVETKHTILKPILSRFCEIYVYNPIRDIIPHAEKLCPRRKYLKNMVTNVLEYSSIDPIPNILKIGEKLYAKAYNSNDIISIMTSPGVINLPMKRRYELIFEFNKIKKEFRCEEMLICFMLWMMIT